MTILPISIEKSASTLVGIFGAAAPAHARERLEEYDGDVGKDGTGSGSPWRVKQWICSNGSGR